MQNFGRFWQTTEIKKNRHVKHWTQPLKLYKVCKTQWDCMMLIKWTQKQWEPLGQQQSFVTFSMNTEVPEDFDNNVEEETSL